jgi:FkbM family methyltransferase
MDYMRKLARWSGPGLAGRIVRRMLRAMAEINLMLAEKLRRPVVRSKYGPVFVANYRDATFRYYIKASYGRYYWDRLLRIDHPFIFLDIGANQGLYAIGAARNPNLVRCYAFEPVAHTFKLLQTNIRLNRAEAKCIPIQKAVADRIGKAEIALVANHSGGATLADANPVVSREANRETIELVDATFLQDLIAERDHPLVVKVDVEGLERVVIAELLRMGLAANIREIYLEVDERWVDAAALQDLLRQAGFSQLTRVGSGIHYDLLAER